MGFFKEVFGHVKNNIKYENHTYCSNCEKTTAHEHQRVGSPANNGYYTVSTCKRCGKQTKH